MRCSIAARASRASSPTLTATLPSRVMEEARKPGAVEDEEEPGVVAVQGLGLRQQPVGAQPQRRREEDRVRLHGGDHVVEALRPAPAGRGGRRSTPPAAAAGRGPAGRSPPPLPRRRRRAPGTPGPAARRRPGRRASRAGDRSPASPARPGSRPAAGVVPQLLQRRLQHVHRQALDRRACARPRPAACSARGRSAPRIARIRLAVTAAGSASRAGARRMARTASSRVATTSSAPAAVSRRR